MSARYNKNGVGASSTSKSIFPISVETCTVPIDVITLPLLNLIEAFPAVDISIITAESSRVSTRYCSLLTVDILAAPVLGRIP